MIYLYIISAVILAYLLGSIPFAVWTGLLFFKKDVRKEGSGNAGTTNVIRVLGWKAGIPVFLLDVMKGWMAVSITMFFPEQLLAGDHIYYLGVILAVAVVMGHIYPVFAGFNGGKGIATLLGVGIALYPFSGLSALGVFFIVFFLSGYVSLSSIISCISFPFLSFFLFGNTELPLVILSIAVAVFVPLTHTKNIRRLLSGTESRFLYKRLK
ncbi:MAG: glycerol-3-phosphate 1-O-acyltransferase PlsY [Bacteroidales bacterium]|nr:glycerol-3-phosphate 1-O-acyltransferase PlsY [Bacteroidales bacterium]